MPVNVRDRDEILLNAIATGDTSGIEPRDREELFIKAIAEKSPDSFYPFGTSYEFKVNSNYDILRVLDGFGNELNFEKIKSQDLIGSQLIISDTMLGYAFGGVILTSEKEIMYYTAYPTFGTLTIFSITINFETKKASYQSVITLS